jgi:hypothetical protein
LFHNFWSHKSQDMHFGSLFSFSGIHFQNHFKPNRSEMLSTPRAVHTRVRGEADRQARGGIRPHPSAGRGRGGGGFAGSHRRRGRRRRGHHHRDHRAKADTLVQAARPEELRKRLVVANGGVAELLLGSEPSPAELGRGEGLTGTGEVVRCWCA